MLAFSLIFDSHFHLNEENSCFVPSGYNGIISCSSREEWNAAEKFSLPKTFGIHPWEPDIKKLDFLEQLLEEDKITGTGECGFDFYTDESKKTEAAQKECWNAQLSLALEYKKPLVIHSRKSYSRILEDSALLSKLPAVCFHGYSGSREQAQEILRKIPEAFFSFGTVLLRNPRKAFEAFRSIPYTHILLETDASGTSFLADVYEKAWDCISDKNDFDSIESFAGQILQNNAIFAGKNHL